MNTFVISVSLFAVVSHAVNYTSQNLLPKSFSQNAFFNAVSQNCSSIASHLQVTPLDSKNITKDRFHIAQVYSECVSSQYGAQFACSDPFTKLKFLPVEAFPAMYHTQEPEKLWRNETLPTILARNESKLPDIVPIMAEACRFDYDFISNSSCCTKGASTNMPCGQESFNLLACSIQSVRTYVSCTARNETDVKSCVSRTAKRINFVPIGFQVDSNGNECPSPSSTMGHLTRVTIVDFFVFLLLENPGFWIRLYRRLVRKEAIKVRTRKFRVTNLGFWATVAKDICENVVLVGVVLQRQGYQIDLFKNFVLFSIRPRGVFFHALLGYIDGGWGPDAFIDMISQILLSIFGGYVALFGAIGANHTMDPTRPAWWKTYLAGGAMTSIITDILLAYVGICGISVAFICCGGLVVLLYLVSIPSIFAFTMLILAPLSEVKIMLQNLYHILRYRTRYCDPASVFTFHNKVFSIWYKVTMFVSLILSVGCWMFWNGFLRLSGELYCPQDLSHVDLVMIGFYIACVLARKLFSFLQGENATGYEGGDGDGDVTPLKELSNAP